MSKNLKPSHIFFLISPFVLLVATIFFIVLSINLVHENQALKKNLFYALLGLQPDSEIIQSLQRRESFSLIPFEGILGGTPGFYSKKLILELDARENTILAFWEDGHIGGYVLLKYSRGEDGLSWHVIDSYLAQ